MKKVFTHKKGDRRTFFDSPHGKIACRLVDRAGIAVRVKITATKNKGPYSTGEIVTVNHRRVVDEAGAPVVEAFDAARLNEYLFQHKGELRAINEVLEAALNSGANQAVRQALQELAQHHTDLENAIEGNG